VKSLNTRWVSFLVKHLITIYWPVLVCSVAFGVSVQVSFAQAPGWSRGQQTLALSYNDCVGRMAAALQAEGYRRDDQPGGNFAVGIKDVHTAVIICSPAPDSKMLVQIVVASNGPGGGAERQKLQAQMERPTAIVCCGELRIIHATYGEQGKFSDVTQRLQSLVRDAALKITITNDSMGGDPNFGIVKKLHIQYVCRNGIFDKTFDENSSLSIP